MKKILSQLDRLRLRANTMAENNQDKEQLLPQFDDSDKENLPLPEPENMDDSDNGSNLPGEETTTDDEENIPRKQVRTESNNKLDSYVYHPRPDYDLNEDPFGRNEVFDCDWEYPAMQQFFKCHIFNALGAVLHTHQDFIVWMDYPYDRLMDRFDIQPAVSDRQYYAGGLATQPYYYMKLTASLQPQPHGFQVLSTFNLGVDAAMQMRQLRIEPRAHVECEKVKGNHCQRCVNYEEVDKQKWERTKLFGLRPHIYRWHGFEAEVLVLILDAQLVREPAVRDRLQKWLKMPPKWCAYTEESCVMCNEPAPGPNPELPGSA